MLEAGLNACPMLQGDIPARQMIESLPGVDPARRAKVMQVLDIDPEWRMHRVSDGQRRRVQICMGLLSLRRCSAPMRFMHANPETFRQHISCATCLLRSKVAVPVSR